MARSSSSGSLPFIASRRPPGAASGPLLRTKSASGPTAREITASKLALKVALYAVKNELRGADLLVATNATMQDLAREALETLRHPVKLD